MIRLPTDWNCPRRKNIFYFRSFITSLVSYLVSCYLILAFVNEYYGKPSSLTFFIFEGMLTWLSIILQYRQWNILAFKFETMRKKYALLILCFFLIFIFIYFLKKILKFSARHFRRLQSHGIEILHIHNSICRDNLFHSAPILQSNMNLASLLFTAFSFSEFKYSYLPCRYQWHCFKLFGVFYFLNQFL